jgi:hypothetical protein
MRSKTAAVLSGAFSALALFCLVETTDIPKPPTTKPCTESWFLYLETHYFPTADDEGHGPDLGDLDWFSIFERKAKLPDGSGLPDKLRCARIQNELGHRTYIVNRLLGLSLFF